MGCERGGVWGLGHLHVLSCFLLDVLFLCLMILSGILITLLEKTELIALLCFSFVACILSVMISFLFLLMSSNIFISGSYMKT